MVVETYPMGPIQANCYLIWKDNHVLIVDPGSSSRKIVTHIKNKDGIVDGILLTHGHFDHIAGVDFFLRHFECKVWIAQEEYVLAKSAKLNCSSMYEAYELKVDVQFYQPKMHIGVFTFEVISAPGHSDGSVLLLFDTFMMSGDVLFKQSVGRQDLPTGSFSKMSQTLLAIKQMDANLIVYPGHGEATTIQDEIQNNPYL